MTINGGFALNGNQSFRNLIGTTLEICSTSPLTGYFRNGYCATCPDDFGLHTVCAQMTQEFLDFTRSQGNDLTTPHPPAFPGLQTGDKWCLCASRWFEAFQVGKAPNVVTRATNSVGLHQEQINNLLSKAIDMIQH